MRYSSYQPSFIAVETVVVPIKYTVKNSYITKKLWKSRVTKKCSNHCFNNH